MKKQLTSLLSASLFACVLASSVNAQSVIVNGGFESDPITSGSVTVTSTPNTSFVTGWTLASTSSSDFAITDTNTFGGAFPNAVEGNRYLAFNVANTAATSFIFQDFATTIGATYTVSFSAGRTGETGLVGIRSDIFNVVSGSTSGGALSTASSSFDSSVSSSTFYDQTDYTFIATGETSRIVFTDISSVTASTDLLLDGVSVTMTASAIPEPSTYAAMFGACALGFAAYRRRQKNKTSSSVVAAA